MNLRIYQINPERDAKKRKFMGLDMLPHQSVDAGIYDRVFMGDVECTNLEDVYYLFNTEGHRLHRGHSLSVSDVVEVCSDGLPTFYFCDTVGFKQIDFSPAKSHVPDNLIRILVVEPHRRPYESEIPNSLEGQQAAVDGLIQYLSNDDGTILVCNDEAKLIGMEGNRRYGSDVIAGPFFLAGDTGEALCSLTDNQMLVYMKRFGQPEEISPEEVEANTGITFISL